MSKSIEALVNHQIQRWDLCRRSSVSEPPLPCVALSRPLGAGAAELGRKVAEEFGFPFFNREIVELIARRTGYREQMIEGVDERIRNAIDRYVTDGFARKKFSESDYLRQVVRIMATLGERGGAVIMGRGAQFILRPERTLRVLVVAPKAKRVEELRKRQGISAPEAQELVRQSDISRNEFLKYHFGRESNDPGDYDLCVNTGSFALEAAVNLVISAYRERFPGAKR
jgi:cytidylate kinase